MNNSSPPRANLLEHNTRVPVKLPAWGTVAVLLAVAFSVFCRRPDLLARPQFWAEDGRVLFITARVTGWTSWWQPFPGYPIVVGRVVALLVNLLPVRWAPAAYAYTALGLLLGAAWFCLRARLDRFIDARGRIAMALALVLVPNGGEMFLSVMGAQWILAPTLWILILQDPPRTRGQGIVDFAVLLLAGLTGPFLVLFAPWFAVRWRQAGGGVSRYNLALVGGAWVLTLVQLIYLSRGGTPHGPFEKVPMHWLKELGVHLPGDLFFGAYVPQYLEWAFWAIAPFSLLALGWALYCAERERSLAAAVMLTGGLVAYFGGIIMVGGPTLDGMSAFGGAQRYFYPFYLAAMWMAVLFCFDSAPKLRLAAVVSLGLMLLSSASMFFEAPLQDLHWQTYARRIEAGESHVVVPINPPGWSVVVDKQTKPVKASP